MDCAFIDLINSEMVPLDHKIDSIVPVHLSIECGKLVIEAESPLVVSLKIAHTLSENVHGMTKLIPHESWVLDLHRPKD